MIQQWNSSATPLQALVQPIGADGVNPVSSSNTLPVGLAGTGANASQVQGPVASGSGLGAIQSFPILVLALNSDEPAATSNRVITPLATLSGHLITQPGGVPQVHDAGGVVLANTTETTLVAALTANRHLLQALICFNPDSVAHTFIFRDTTAGTVRWKVRVPAGDSKPIEFPAGFPAAAQNTNWTAQLGETVVTTSPEVYSSSYHTTA